MRQAIEVALPPAIYDRYVLTLDEARFAQSLPESSLLQLDQRTHAG